MIHPVLIHDIVYVHNRVISAPLIVAIFPSIVIYTPVSGSLPVKLKVMISPIFAQLQLALLD